MTSAAGTLRISRIIILAMVLPLAPACTSSPSAPSASSTVRPPTTTSVIAPAPTLPSATASPTTRSAAAVTNLAGAIGDYLAVPFLANRYRNLRALIVTVRGRTMFERYYHSSPSTYLNTQSEGKTIIGNLIGIALAEGRLRSVNERLPDLLPRYAGLMTPQDREITLRQLLTMSAGMPRDDVFYPKVFDTKKDWISQVLIDGPSFAFGKGFSYSSAGAHVLSAILSEATGQSTLAYARTKLFDPLGIRTTPATELVASRQNLPAYERADFAWLTDPQGHHTGSGGIKLTARDMVKLGQLWLDKGKWHGRQVVPAAWLDQSQRRQVDTNGEPAAYGFLQWVTVADGHPAFAAIGFGGQVTEVVPELGLVVVTLAASPTDPNAPLESGTADAPDYLDMVGSVIAPVVDRR